MHHADCSYNFFRGVNVVAGGIERIEILAVKHVAPIIFELNRMMFIQRGPGPEVVPAETGAQAKQLRRMLAFRGAGLKNSVIDADVFAFRIQLCECLPECLCAPCSPHLSPTGPTPWTMCAQL